MVIWDSAVEGICYDGCSGLYCNPLHFGAYVAGIFCIIVVLIWLIVRMMQERTP